MFGNNLFGLLGMMRKPSRQNVVRATEAYSLPEVVISIVIIGTLLVALYAAINAGFTVMKAARENLRATQLLIQRAEVIRLYNWTQVRDTNKYLKPFFTDYYDPLGVAAGKQGVVYSGTVRTQAFGFSGTTYAANMRSIVISVYWTNRIGKTNVTFSRELVTHVARYGVQNYVYGP